MAGTKKAEVVEQKTAVVTSTPALIEQTLTRLAEAGENAPAMVDALEKLVAMQERQEAKEAERSFNRALARFQSECPIIPKNRAAEMVTSSGMRVKYTFADLPQIERTIRKLLTENGFAYTWDSEQDGNAVTTTCRLSHEDGHSRTAKHRASIDERNKVASGPQKEGISAMYGRRNSLVQVLGLTSADPDTDGLNRCENPITEEQAADIRALLTEVGADEGRFLKYMGVESVEDITVDAYDQAINALERKRGQ